MLQRNATNGGGGTHPDEIMPRTLRDHGDTGDA